MKDSNIPSENSFCAVLSYCKTGCFSKKITRAVFTEVKMNLLAAQPAQNWGYFTSLMVKHHDGKHIFSQVLFSQKVLLITMIKGEHWWSVTYFFGKINCESVVILVLQARKNVDYFQRFCLDYADRSSNSSSRDYHMHSYTKIFRAITVF